jgi:uncharacterized phage-associated protein
MAFDVALVKGYFEAWEYGPVHPALYAAFKNRGSSTIEPIVTQFHPLTRKEEPVLNLISQETEEFLDRNVGRYLEMSAGELVELSHAPQSPWDVTTRRSSQKAGRAWGARITNDLIRERFRFHKVVVSQNPKHGEPSEDSPPP